MKSEEVKAKLAAAKWSVETNTKKTYYTDNANLDIVQNETCIYVRGSIFGETGIRGFGVVETVFEKLTSIEEAENFVAEKI